MSTLCTRAYSTTAYQPHTSSTSFSFSKVGYNFSNHVHQAPMPACITSTHASSCAVQACLQVFSGKGSDLMQL